MKKHGVFKVTLNKLLMHESVKNEVAAAVETAAIALINANESGDRERYQAQLNTVTSDIHQLYMHLFILEKASVNQSKNSPDIHANGSDNNAIVNQ